LLLADELLSPHISFRGSLGVKVQGLDGFKDYVKMIRSAFPDFYNTIEELIAEDDKVVARLTYSGTHEGEICGIAPTGRRVSYSGMAIFRLTDNKILSGWILSDTLSLIKQLKEHEQKE
jgi:predicted ester cyclase